MDVEEEIGAGPPEAGRAVSGMEEVSTTMIGAGEDWDVATDVADWPAFVAEIGFNSLDCDSIGGVGDNGSSVRLASNCIAVEGVYRM